MWNIPLYNRTMRLLSNHGKVKVEIEDLSSSYRSSNVRLSFPPSRACFFIRLTFMLFILAIGIFAPADVRPILKAYQGKDIPSEYAKKEAEQKKMAVDEWERLHPSSVHGAGFGFLSTMFGSVAAVS